MRLNIKTLEMQQITKCRQTRGHFAAVGCPRFLVSDDSTKAIARVERFNRFQGSFDAFEPVSNVVVELEVPVLVVIDERRHLIESVSVRHRYCTRQQA